MQSDYLNIVGGGSRSAVSYVFQKYQLENSAEAHTLAKKYPGHGHLYLTLMSKNLSYYIRKWIGTVSDCYSLLEKADSLHTVEKSEENGIFDYVEGAPALCDLGSNCR